MAKKIVLAERENALLKKYINRLGPNWHELPEDNPSRVRMQKLVRSISWNDWRTEYEDIKSWTNKEINFIEANLEKMTSKEMAEILKRPELSVRGQMAKAKVKIRNRKGRQTT